MATYSVNHSLTENSQNLLSDPMTVKIRYSNTCSTLALAPVSPWKRHKLHSVCMKLFKKPTSNLASTIDIIQSGE